MNTVRQHPARNWMLLLLIAIVGLFYVKWFPYWQRAFVAADKHSIGASILMGASANAPDPSLKAAFDYAVAYGNAIWKAMVLGLLLGSGVQALLPRQWVARAMGGSGFGSVMAGGVLSLPGMMCTCCAAPVVVGLRARQASPGAAMAFWLGNTILNPATLVFMGFVLGWNWTVLRLVLGVLMVFGLGYLMNRLVTPQEAQAAQQWMVQGEADEDGSVGSVFSRWLRILGRMALRLLPEYIVLVLLLGAVRAYLFPHIGPEIGNGLPWIIGFAVAGTLFVIPTAGEVPIIGAMFSLGMGVGPAGALLMTLPPISVPSLAMLLKSFSKKMLAAVVIAVIGFGVVAGLLAVALF